ncbi:MAG: hypothetical protein HY244_12455 [Rhizobiales bacterium]|nr:hypothetical protein [Hyphomicrobiales bacterium]
MAPIVRPYISPKERAQNRARWIRIAYWTAVTIPVLVGLTMVGYSDQAPAWLRAFTVNLDALFGFPVLWLIKLIAA